LPQLNLFNNKFVKPKYELTRNYAAELFLPMEEKTFQESSVVPDTLRKPFNPDDIYVKRGDLSLYEEMVNDDQVSVALQLKKDLVLNSGWDIVVEDQGDEEIRDDLEASLREDIQEPLEDLLEEMLSSFEFGYSITEKIFKRRKGRI